MSLTTLNHEYQELMLEAQAQRLAAERRFRVPGCPWDCEDGFHEIALCEYGPLDDIPENDLAVIVLPHMILSACECNSGAGGRVRRWPGWVT